MSRTPALIAGTILTGVGLAFNASYGWSLGGSDILRSIGMAGVFVACVGLKDWMLGQSALAVRARRYGLAAACITGLIIGAAGSFLAAFGSASEGRDAKADPRAAQIVAFQTASKIEKETEARLAELGSVPNPADAKAAVARTLAAVEPGIAKRTQGCTVFSTEASKRVQAVNRESCLRTVEATAIVSRAEEAADLRAKLEEARQVIAKGAPKAADPLVANVQAFLSTGIDAAAVLSLIVALIVELGAPVCWMIWQMSEPGKPAQAIPGIPANDAAVPGIVIPRNPFPGNDPPTGGRRGRKPDPRIVNFSEAFREKHGRPPSGSEIKSYFPGIPTSTAYDYAKRA
jgi:hypothetical protein